MAATIRKEIYLMEKLFIDRPDQLLEVNKTNKNE